MENILPSRHVDPVGRDTRNQLVLRGAVCCVCRCQVFPFSNVCPSCMGEQMSVEEFPRTGTLYSFTVMHVGPSEWRKPFAVGYVDLTNGVRVFAHLEGSRPLKIGATVELTDDVVPVGADQGVRPLFAFRSVGS
ncbi:Zn-ribbon domain-containing OB-fold protein [Paraburkholderia sediminicola]|uniref:Zn-ribbon domain-containing OB-fold protein n=2 Tax=Burkholderiaceae TaxID=119060 RepID=UPI0038BDB07A